ncbi:helix-turn-helix domain-containing protein [Paenibacillus chitinolyticus]|uniref:helix-turn-helix domain-containing protein n=1 Tax=Paenibacillus chitinolyticus TaxID=79263 RepID=UPI003D03DDBA
MNKDFKLMKALTELLDSEERWFTFGEAERELGISDKSIRKLVEEITALLPGTMSIEVSRGKGIFFRRERHGPTIREILVEQFRQTSYYRLMHRLFIYGGQASAEELAEFLYMSASSFKKFIIQLNREDLKPSCLRLAYSSPALKGNEIHIRYFYWKLFSDSHPYTGWPFAEIDFGQIQEWITQLEEEQGIVYFLNSKRSLIFLIAVTLERIRQGHSVSVNGKLYDWENGAFYESVCRLAGKLGQEYGLDIAGEEIYFLQSLCSLSQYHYRNEREMALMQEEALHRNEEPKYRMINNLLPLLRETFPSLAVGHRFVMEMCEFFEKLMIDNAVPELMEVSKSRLIAYMRREEPFIYEGVTECINRWRREYPAVSVSSYHLVKLGFIVSSNVRYKSKKAFLIIGEEFSVRHYVANRIKREIGDELTIETSILHELSDETVREREIDFIISTMPVALKTVPAVIISAIPTKRDLENIRKELLE